MGLRIKPVINRQTCSNPSPRQKIFLKLSSPLARISGTRIIASMAPPFFFYLTPLIFLHSPIFPNNLPSRVYLQNGSRCLRDGKRSGVACATANASFGNSVDKGKAAGAPAARRWHIARYVAYRPDVGTSDRLLLKQSVFVDAAAKEAVVRGRRSRVVPQLEQGIKHKPQQNPQHYEC